MSSSATALPSSPRLRYCPLAAADLAAFHVLVTDEHVRRYLLDGEGFSREWTAARIAGQGLAMGEGLW